MEGVIGVSAVLARPFWFHHFWDIKETCFAADKDATWREGDPAKVLLLPQSFQTNSTKIIFIIREEREEALHGP